MRILLVNRSGTRIGGIEGHLQHLLPALQGRGHEVGFLHQEPIPGGVEALTLSGAPTWCAASQETKAILAAIDRWAPDVVYAHQLVEPELVRGLQSRWPTVYFAHCYLGVCVSTTKCWKSPQPRPCQRVLGWGCLLHYFPHRCGGLNPWIMWRLFGEQREAQELLRGFDLMATHTDYVRQEYLRHGFALDRVVKVPFWVPGGPLRTGEPRTLPTRDRVKLLFLGRFEVVKGGGLLLDALPRVAARLGRNVALLMAGDGPERPRWEDQARRLMAAHPEVIVAFPGWLRPPARDGVLAETDLLVAPSVWPEPFGMTGIEAGYQGVPSVAFDVGGVREWLTDGVNGRLAGGNPPSPDGLADAIVGVLSDGGAYEAYSRNAREATNRFQPGPHLEAVENLLTRARAIHVRLPW